VDERREVNCVVEGGREGNMSERKTTVASDCIILSQFLPQAKFEARDLASGVAISKILEGWTLKPLGDLKDSLKHVVIVLSDLVMF